MFIVSKVSFAAEDAAADPAPPCACPNCGCDGTLPFTSPPYLHHRIFGNRLALLAGMCHGAQQTPQVLFATELCEGAVVGAAYPYPNANFRVRRAARLASPPFQPCLSPFYGAAAMPTVVAPTDMPGFATSYRRVPGPVINFLSNVCDSHPCDPYAGFYQVCPNCPSQACPLQ